MKVEFGYLPRRLDLSVGDISIQTLDSLSEKIERVSNGDDVDNGWIFSPRQLIREFASGRIHEKPFDQRIFGLPKTHCLIHSSSNDAKQLHFHIWALSFILGIQLTETEAGFCDATPILPGKLTDFVLASADIEKAVASAERFFQQYKGNTQVISGITGVLHSLFWSQKPTLLDFERFIYLYIAFDGCYATWRSMVNARRRSGKKRRPPPHAKRITELCRKFKAPVPDWARPKRGMVAGIRNKTLHEGLFFDEPLGFQIFGGSKSARGHRNFLLEMESLVCRFVFELLGLQDLRYIRSAINTRQIQGIKLL